MHLMNFDFFQASRGDDEMKVYSYCPPSHHLTFWLLLASAADHINEF